MDGYLTPREVSERYKGAISTKTLANWRARGIGPPYTKIGGRILYRIAHIQEWEATRTVEAERESA